MNDTVALVLTGIVFFIILGMMFFVNHLDSKDDIEKD